MAAAPPLSLLTSPADCRAEPRRELLLRVRGRLPSGDEDVLLVNISPAGVLIESPASLSKGAKIAIALPDSAPIEATVVWARQGYAGCRFNRQLSREEISRALLRSDIAQPGKNDLMQAQAAVEAVEHDEAGNMMPPAPDLRPAQRPQLVLGLAVGSWALLLAMVALLYLLLT